MFEAAGPLGWASAEWSAAVQEESQMRHEVPEASVGMRSPMSAVLADISCGLPVTSALSRLVQHERFDLDGPVRNRDLTTFIAMANDIACRNI